MTGAVATWWMMLCAVAALNIGAWGISAAMLPRRKSRLSPEAYATRRWLLWLSAAYVLGCGFRSLLPMVDAARFCLADTPLSRIAVGRSIATVAELCFVAQWALLMRETGRDLDAHAATLVSRVLLPLIVAAELFSWYAVLTTNYFAHLVENSLWTVSAALVLASFAFLWPRLKGRSRQVLAAATLSGIAYIAFMVAIDLPMYYSRWQADLAAGRQFLTLGEGALEVMLPCMVNHDWQAWREEIPWMTLYFTFGVWTSIALVDVPPLKPRQR